MARQSSVPRIVGAPGEPQNKRPAADRAASSPPAVSAPLSARWERERGFHDALADSIDPTIPPPVDLNVYEAAVLDAAGIRAGARVLDLGCGQGDLTLRLLDRGAIVTALDLSPRMLAVARRRVALHAEGRRAHFVAAPVERTGLPAASFDAIVGMWILHHVDLRLAAAELVRILTPGGRAVFIENSGENPVLNFARAHIAGRFGIPLFGTHDERPMVPEDWRALETSFSAVQRRFPITDVFELLNRQVFRYRSPKAAALCRRLDGLIGRTPWRRYSYRVLVVADK